MRPVPKRTLSDEWELVELDDPGVWVGEPITEWKDLHLPLPPPRPRGIDD